MSKIYHLQSFLIIGLFLILPAVVSAQTSVDTLESTFSLSEETTEVSSVSLAQPVNEEVKMPYRIEVLPDEVVVGDFVLSPGKIELRVEPGETKVFNVSVANRIGETKFFEIEVEDGGVSSDPKRAIVLLGEARGPYSIKDYVSMPALKFPLDHARRAVIPVTVSVPLDAEPGGHYGSILIKTVTQAAVDGSDPGTSPSSAVVSRIGALVFITIPGDIETEGKLTSFSTINDQSWFSKGPIEFGITYKNTGSVYVNPYGEIRIKNLANEEVGFIELDPWFVLPGAERLRQITWNKDILFGRYSATLSLNRGYDNLVDVSTVTFWVVPWQYALAIVLPLILVIWLIRFVIRNFEFKRKQD